MSDDWRARVLGLATLPAEGSSVTRDGQALSMREGVVRASAPVSAAQSSTSDIFGFKWAKRDTFEREEVRATMRTWLNERYGAVETLDLPTAAVVLDAGCGAGFSALEYFAPVLNAIRYIGADISEAVDVAADRFREHGTETLFIQSDLGQLPLQPASCDLIFSEGVLHHTDSTEQAFQRLVPLLRPGGVFAFYVYRRKGPIREFTDDYIRDRLQEMTPDQAWEAMLPLTRLGKALGDLDIEVDVPEAVPLLDIPAGKVNLQRLFYWHVFKAYYRPDYSVDEMAHINFDWYAPKNAHRHSEDEVRGWCRDAGLAIERVDVQPSGITVVARKPAGAGGER